MRSPFVLAGKHPLNLFTLFHEIHFGVEAARRINDHHIDMACFGSLNGVINDGCRVGTHTMLDHFHADAIGPFLQLLDRRCAKSICCS